MSTLELNFGIHLEASKLILALLPPNVNIGPVHTSFFSMLQRFAFEIAFKNMTQVSSSSFNYKRFFEDLAATKNKLARDVRSQLTDLKINPNLPIAELKQVR
jgi:hypothetical protein